MMFKEAAMMSSEVMALAKSKNSYKNCANCQKSAAFAIVIYIVNKNYADLPSISHGTLVSTLDS